MQEETISIVPRLSGESVQPRSGGARVLILDIKVAMTESSQRTADNRNTYIPILPVETIYFQLYAGGCVAFHDRRK
jgi:hypothetical protein